MTDRMKALEDELSTAKIRYENSPWAMGPHWRAEIDRIKREIATLKEEEANA